MGKLNVAVAMMHLYPLGIRVRLRDDYPDTDHEIYGYTVNAAGSDQLGADSGGGLMEMSNEEIIRRYKQAKHKAAQIQILADLNACPKSKILEIVSDSIVPRHPTPAQPKEQPETVKAVDNLASFEEYVVNRMDEIDGQLKTLEKEYADLSVTLLTIGRYGEERASVHE